MGWPARVAAPLAAELGSEPAAVLRILEREMRRLLSKVREPRVH
jgi:hypothetical protein